jgi:hypothetical protein
VIECFLGITHVRNTIAAKLKKTIDSVLSRHNLNITDCEDKDSNM